MHRDRDGQDREASPRGQGWQLGSITHSGGKLYVTNQAGQTLVLSAEPDFEVLTTNPVDEMTRGSAAFSNGQVFLRTYKQLWCWGKRASEDSPGPVNGQATTPRTASWRKRFLPPHRLLVPGLFGRSRVFAERPSFLIVLAYVGVQKDCPTWPDWNGRATNKSESSGHPTVEKERSNFASPRFRHQQISNDQALLLLPLPARRAGSRIHLGQG